MQWGNSHQRMWPYCVAHCHWKRALLEFCCWLELCCWAGLLYLLLCMPELWAALRGWVLLQLNLDCWLYFWSGDDAGRGPDTTSKIRTMLAIRYAIFLCASWPQINWPCQFPERSPWGKAEVGLQRNAQETWISALGSHFPTGETIDSEVPSRCCTELAWGKEEGDKLIPLLLSF